MRWTVHGERKVYASRWLTVALADVEIPDGARFEHHLVRLDEPAASCVVDDPERGVLLLWRHRFITDTWGWEVPAGRIDAGEPLAAAAARECLEESGWRPLGELAQLGTWYPTNGLCDQAFHAFRAVAAEHVGEPEDAYESERIEWLTWTRVREEIAAGRVLDGFSLTSLLLALADPP
ncbi:MAG TPA: NUDIX domain-containing protein [Gaiellaceae bacterium]|jgi:8-oxo-dGTP pyrophosphatase MutT (NUDIX family)